MAQLTFIVRNVATGLLLCAAAASTLCAEPYEIAAQESAYPHFVRVTEAVPKERHYLTPTFEILSFQLLLNQFDRHFSSDSENFQSNANTIQANLKRKWAFDKDPFGVNQIGHPYQGSVYFGFARSSGLNFWESSGYTTVGSYLWEIGGERSRPSINDQITTTLGGSFLGEALCRMARVLGDTDQKQYSLPIEGLIAPATIPNRFLYAQVPYAKPLPPSLSHVRAGSLLNEDVHNSGSTEDADRFQAALGFDMQYGTPGNEWYQYREPLDYFNFEGLLSTSENDILKMLSVNGLLYGTDYASNIGTGIWGIYGSYDYLSEEIFRVASSALLVGTTDHWAISNALVFDGGAQAGAGFGIGGSHSQTEKKRDHHFGIIPQARIDLGLTLHEVTSVKIGAREYYVAGRSSDAPPARNERIFIFRTSLDQKISPRYSISLTYEIGTRDAFFSTIASRHERINTLGLFLEYKLS